MLWKVVLVWILHILRLDLCSLMGVKFFQLYVYIVVCQDTVPVPEAKFKLAVKYSVILIVCLENFTTSTVRFVFFEFTLVGLFALLVSFQVVSYFTETMLHIVKIVTGIMSPIEEPFFTKAMFGPMRIVALIVYLIILRQPTTAMELIVPSIEVSNIVAFVQELEIPILKHSIDKRSNE